MDIKIILAILVVIAVYGYVYKIPLVCYGCEEPGAITSLFFKCVIDTSKDSELCKITSNIDDLPAQITETGRRVTNAVVKEVTENIPKTIKLAYDNLMIEIGKIVRLIMENLENFRQKVFEFLKDAYEDVKDVVIKSKDVICEKLVKPVLKYLTQFVVEPIKNLIAMLLDFKDLLASSIESAVRDITGVVVNLKNNLVGVVSSIPKYIEEFINAIMDIINFTTDETVNRMNNAVSTVVGTTNTAIGGMAGAVNQSSSAITNASKDIAKNVEKGVNEVVNGINTGVVDGVNTSLTKLVDGLKLAINDGIIKPVNVTGDGISLAVNSSVNPIINVVNETVSGINKARDVSIPKLEIPEIRIPEFDIKIAKIPSAVIINKTQITPEIKPFGGLPVIGRVNGINLDVKDIPGVQIGYAPRIPKVNGVEFDLNYNIPEITGPNKSNPGQFVSVNPNLIPKPNPINGGTPKDGSVNFLNIKKGGFLPQIRLDPAIKTITSELNKPIEQASSFIKNIYDENMEPINKVIQDLISMSQALVEAVKTLFNRYLNQEYLDLMVNGIQKGMSYTYGMAIEIIKEKVIKPMFNLLNMLKDQLMKNIMLVIEIIKGIFKLVLGNLQILFSKVADVLYETGKVVVKTTGYFIFYWLGKYVDLIPLPVNVTMKFNIVIFNMIIFLYAMARPYLEEWRLILFSIIALSVVSFGFIKSIQPIEKEKLLNSSFN